MNCIIIDDEPLARQGMELLIQQIPSLQLSGSFSNAMEAYAHIKQYPTDLMFVDINMPELNGLDYVKGLTAKPMVVFVTAYPQYALDSYELDALDYLVKPVRIERLWKAVARAENYLELTRPGLHPDEIESISEEYIFIKSERKFFKIHYRDILYIEGLKDYVILHLGKNRIVTAMNIKTIAAKLPKSIFARINKSFIVNITHIISFDTYNVYLQNEELPIGDNFKEAFFSFYVNGKLLKR